MALVRPAQVSSTTVAWSEFPGAVPLVDMSHILLATDGSESAQEAISFLHKLLRPGFAEKITIVSVVNEHETELLLSVPDVNIPGGTLEELEDSEEQEAKDIARTAMAAVKG